MKNVVIKSVSLQGFRSYANPTKFVFSHTGLHLIKGDNGEGKTSLFSGLTWCLYKINLNNTNNSRIPTFKWMRPTGFIGTRVMVVFGLGRYKYLVARHIGYKGLTKGITGEDSLLIFKKEKVDKTPITAKDLITDPLYKADAQGYLNMLLGIDGKTFLSSVVFGQRMTRLMEAKNDDKRDLFEKLFDADFIDDLKDKAVARQSEVTSALQVLKEEHIEVSANFSHLTTQLENASNIVEEFAANRKLRLAEIKEKHKAEKAALAETEVLIAKAEKKAQKPQITTVLGELLAQTDTKREAYYEVKERLSNARRDVNDFDRQITKAEVVKNELWVKLKAVKDNCPTCGAKLDAKQVAKAKETIEDEIKDQVEIVRTLGQSKANLEVSVQALAVECNKANEAFTTAMDAQQDAKQATQAISGSQTELMALKQKKALIEADIKNIAAAFATEKERQPPTVNISQIELALAKVTVRKPILEKQIKKQENLHIRITWWVKNAFGAGGLKAFVFSAMLNKLNENLHAYTSYFGYGVTFGIDLTKPSKPFYGKVTLDGVNECEYADLSGGQKQKIDLCIAFAMHDSVATKTIFNIIMFDEVSEGLDPEAQDMLSTLLNIKSQSKAVYVISHSNLLDLVGATEYTVVGGNKGVSTIS